jgi:hypothetical protein
MAVSGQLCREAEGLSYNDITLRTPPSSSQNRTLVRIRDILDSYKSVPSGNLAWSRPVQISTSKIASLRSGRFSAMARARCEPVHSGVQ